MTHIPCNLKQCIQSIDGVLIVGTQHCVASPKSFTVAADATEWLESAVLKATHDKAVNFYTVGKEYVIQYGWDVQVTKSLPSAMAFWSGAVSHCSGSVCVSAEKAALKLIRLLLA